MRIFTYLSVAKRKQAKLWHNMAKIQIKSEKLTPFGGFFRVMEQFDSTLSSVIDSTSGMWQNKSYIPTPRATSCAWRTSHRLKESNHPCVLAMCMISTDTSKIFYIIHPILPYPTLKTQKAVCHKPHPIRPERAEAPSTGQRPGLGAFGLSARLRLPLFRLMTHPLHFS